MINISSKVIKKIKFLMEICTACFFFSENGLTNRDIDVAINKRYTLKSIGH